MSDLFEKKLFLSPAARRHSRKAGFALGRILSVIFFVIALGMFFGGLFFWLQKRQASLDSGAAARICATPEMLSGEVKAALKDRVDIVSGLLITFLRWKSRTCCATAWRRHRNI